MYQQEYRGWEIVGLPDTSIREAKERVKTAIKNSDYELKSRKIVINLAPADIKKEGSFFDLPIAIGILICLGEIEKEKAEKIVFIGELSLDGKLNKVDGVLPMCIEAKKLGIKQIVVPIENAEEASIVDGVEILGASNLKEVAQYLNEKQEISPQKIKVEELLKENIPYHIVGGFSFYQRKEIKDLLAYLKLIHNPKDNVSFLRVINTPKRGIGLKSIENLTKKADENNLSLFESIDGGKEASFKEIIEKLIDIKEKISLTELIDKVLDSSGLKHELESEKSLEADIRLENLEEFKSITRSFEAREGEISLEDFLFEVSLVSDKDEYDSTNGKVNLMTVHSVKGLEYDYVFIIGVEEGLFPHMNALMEAGELEEERRLCYVAITRAKKDLYIINARRRVLFGHDQINPPSRFIGEIDASLIESNFHEQKRKEEETIIIGDMFREEEVDYQVGDYVYHESFGTGRVVEVTNTLISVAFKHPIGIKKLMKNHKKISKV